VEEIVLLEGARTPMAEYNGAFADVSAIDLGVNAARAALSRSATDPAEIDHVIFGNALQTSGDAIYGARHVGLKSGVPKEVPAVTVNRLCGSGFESIVQGAHRILLEEATTVLAGGMENMSQAPHVIRGARKGFRLGQGALEDSLMVALLDSYTGLYMAQTSDRVAAKYGITRQEQDEYALSSQRRAAAAWEACRLSEEVVPVDVGTGRKTIRVEKDDHLRPDTTLEGPGEARALLREGRAGHRGKRLRHRGRRRGGGRDVRQTGSREARRAPREARLLGCRGMRSGAHGSRARAGGPSCPGSRGIESRRDRPLGDQRSLRRPDPRRRARARAGSLEVERQRRRDCSRASAGGDRDPLHPHAPERAPPSVARATVSPAPASEGVRGSR
jgi:acetyl-CoA acetyltransferase